MKTFVILLLLLPGAPALHAQQKQTQTMLRHVVLFKFKESSSAADIKRVEDAFRALPSKIKEIKALNGAPTTVPKT
jgi:hypothetical protein